MHLLVVAHCLRVQVAVGHDTQGHLAQVVHQLAAWAHLLQTQQEQPQQQTQRLVAVGQPSRLLVKMVAMVPQELFT